MGNNSIEATQSIELMYLVQVYILFLAHSEAQVSLQPTFLSSPVALGWTEPREDTPSTFRSKLKI